MRSDFSLKYTTGGVPLQVKINLKKLFLHTFETGEEVMVFIVGFPPTTPTPLDWGMLRRSRRVLIFSLNTCGGGRCQTFFFFSPLQQTTGGIGHHTVEMYGHHI